MKPIFKYKLFDYQPGRVTIKLPSDHQILSCQRQGEEIVIWAIVDPESEQQEKSFEIYYTGFCVVDAPLKNHLSTLQHDGIVLHVFEVLA